VTIRITPENLCMENSVSLLARESISLSRVVDVKAAQQAG
jgi:hypothetical protein